ncbi:MAG: DUF503 family protein [Caldibacillus sp.]
MILSMHVECLIYDVQSLKEKRAILQRIITRIKQRFNVAICEMDYQELWQRTALSIVTVASSKVVAEREMQKVIHFIDSFPEIERTTTNYEWL